MGAPGPAAACGPLATVTGSPLTRVAARSTATTSVWAQTRRDPGASPGAFARARLLPFTLTPSVSRKDRAMNDEIHSNTALYVHYCPPCIDFRA